MHWLSLFLIGYPVLPSQPVSPKKRYWFFTGFIMMFLIASLSYESVLAAEKTTSGAPSAKPAASKKNVPSTTQTSSASEAKTPAVTKTETPKGGRIADVSSDGSPLPSELDIQYVEAKALWEMPVVVPDKSERLNTAKLDKAMRSAASTTARLYAQADAQLTRYLFDEAQNTLRVARRATGNQAGQLVRFGQYCLYKGLPELAEESFRFAIIRQEGGQLKLDAEAGLLKAEEARQKAEILAKQAEKRRASEIQAALKDGEEALHWNTRSADAHRILGKLYEKSGDWLRAADHNAAFLRLAPEQAKRQNIPKRIDALIDRYRDAMQS